MTGIRYAKRCKAAFSQVCLFSVSFISRVEQIPTEPRHLEPLLVLLGPLVDLCIRVNHDNNLADFVGHIQRFCEQLVAVVTSLRVRVQSVYLSANYYALRIGF